MLGGGERWERLRERSKRGPSTPQADNPAGAGLRSKSCRLAPVGMTGLRSAEDVDAKISGARGVSKASKLKKSVSVERKRVGPGKGKK